AVKRGGRFQTELIPFADAGEGGSLYKVWLPLPKASASANLLADGQESRSRQGNVSGSIADDDFQTAVVTFNDSPANADWFAVALDEPVTLSRVVFAHGKTFHDGGWFDASGGKPRVEVKLARDGSWESVGTLDDYPATTSGNAAGLSGGERFACVFDAPKRVWAVRVEGKPAGGDNPAQAFSSCAEIQGFEK
ncbi:MAG: hypothetical protein ACREIC_01145, partial [Limisphaerales bacterium]